MTVDAHTIMVAWDDIIAVMRRAAPKPGKYGGDDGGSTPRMVEMLRDEQLVSEIAKRVYEAQIARDAAMSKLAPALRKATQDYNAAMDAIVADVSKRR